jgi:hypothetical protein
MGIAFSGIREDARDELRAEDPELAARLDAADAAENATYRDAYRDTDKEKMAAIMSLLHDLAEHTCCSGISCMASEHYIELSDRAKRILLP